MEVTLGLAFLLLTGTGVWGAKTPNQGETLFEIAIDNVDPYGNPQFIKGEVNPTAGIDTSNGVTLSFWIYPMRFLGDTHIISIIGEEGNDTMFLTVRLMEAEIYVDIDPSTTITVGTVNALTWTNIIVIITDVSVEALIDGGSKTETGTFAVESFNSSVFFMIGGDRKYMNPFSGYIGSIYFYEGEFSTNDVQTEISGGSVSLTKHSLVPNNSSFTSALPQFFETQTMTAGKKLMFENTPMNTLVKTSEVTKSVLSKHDGSVSYFDIGRMNFEDVEDGCEKFGGTIPGSDQISLDEIYSWPEYSGNNINSFWLNDAAISTNLIEMRSIAILGTNGLAKSTVDARNLVSGLCKLSSQPQYRILSKHVASDKMVLDVEDGTVQFTDLSTGTIDVKPNSASLSLSLVYSSYLTPFRTLSRSFNDASQMLGRYEWDNSYVGAPDSKEPKVEVTLTFCKTNEFTCDDGKCIPLKDACNRFSDCEDGSDEKECSPLILIPGYLKKQYPLRNSKFSLETKIGLMSSDLFESNENLVCLRFIQRYNWIDDRLSYRGISKNEMYEIEDDYSEKIWLPSISTSGVISRDRKKLSPADNPSESLMAFTSKDPEAAIHGSREVMVVDGSDTWLYDNRETEVIARCQSRLFYFPYDVKICNLKLSLDDGVAGKMEWGKINVFLKDELEKRAPGGKRSFDSIFKLEDFKVYRDGNATQVSVDITLQRISNSLVITFFVPAVVLQLAALFAFRLDLDQFTNRFLVNLSCIMITAMLILQISGNLPQTGRMKLIDIWVVFYLLVLVFELFAHLSVSRKLGPKVRPPPKKVQVHPEAPAAVKTSDPKKEDKEWEMMKAVLELDKIDIENPPPVPKVPKMTFVEQHQPPEYSPARKMKARGANRFYAFLAALAHLIFHVVVLIIASQK